MRRTQIVLFFSWFTQTEHTLFFSLSLTLSLLIMSRSSYSAVPREEVPLQDVTLERGDGVASAADSSSSSNAAAEGKDEKRPLTKRTLYSSHRIEGRTPRLAGESDEDFKRRVHSQHLAALAHAVVWVLLAVGVLYYTDMINVVRYDVRINQSVTTS
jgi:hypothetical protein